LRWCNKIEGMIDNEALVEEIGDEEQAMRLVLKQLDEL
jgi:hypothetical protein